MMNGIILNRILLRPIKINYVRTIFNGINANNLIKELPSTISTRIPIDQISIKDNVKRTKIETPSNLVKDIVMPSLNFNKTTNIIKEIKLPTIKRNENEIKYCGYFRFGYQKPSFSRHLIRIKRRKMKKHHLRKWRKKYLSVILNRNKLREIRKEKNFRAELLAEIRKAENFNAENYVNGVLRTIDRAPNENPNSLDKLFQLIREHKFETTLVRPKFDDADIPPNDFNKLK